MLRARLAARKGVAPAPSCYVVWRDSARTGAPETRGYGLPEEPGYELPGEPERRDEAAFESWLVERNLAGAERLTVSVLVIREQLDEAGLVREGILERRRGGVDGPYYGNVARVEFTGPALLVRRYRAARDGRLTELPPGDATGVSPFPAEADAESFAGEDAAVRAFVGPNAVIVDRRAPSLFEDLLGLSAIIHVRRPDGMEIGCGVGWHGGTAFVLAADFPRHGRELAPTPELEAAVEKAIRTRHLVRHETRQDEHGFRVLARDPGRRTLVVIRLEGEATRIDPYVPGRGAALNDDQRRWLTYAETYEARTILDSWRNGDSDEIAVLTIDPDNEAWRHIIDADGIEISRVPDNDAAAAVLYQERLNPPDDFPAPAASVESERPESEPVPIPDAAAPAADQEAPADSLLARLRAWSRATALLNEAIAAASAAVPPALPSAHPSAHPAGTDRSKPVREAVVERLTALIEPLSLLNARFTLGSLRRLIAHTALPMEALGAASRELVTRLHDELALTRVILLPAGDGGQTDTALFGALVEQHFPAASYDIEEMAQCLNLRRPTATVLHAMQAMRHALAGLERLVVTPKLADLAWARIVEIVREAAGGEDELAGALVRVHRVWRAPGLLPAAKYTEEEAEAVMAAVRAFMRLLAARLAASGETETF
jgi:hypothetical protein